MPKNKEIRQFAYNLVDFLDSSNLSYDWDWANTFCDNDSYEPQNDIIVYPNPNNGIFAIKNKDLFILLT